MTTNTTTNTKMVNHHSYNNKYDNKYKNGLSTWKMVFQHRLTLLKTQNGISSWVEPCGNTQWFFNTVVNVHATAVFMKIIMVFIKITGFHEKQEK